MSLRLVKRILTAFEVLSFFFTNLRAVASEKPSCSSVVFLDSVKTSSFGTSLMITEWFFCSFRGLLQEVSVPKKVDFQASSISLDSSCVANSRWVWPLVVLTAFINFLFGKVLEKLRLMSVLFLEDGSAFSIRSTAVTSLSIVACWVIALDVPVNATVAKVDAVFSTALLTVLIFCTTPWATSLIDGRSAYWSFDSLIMLSVAIVAACVALSTLVSVSMRITWCCCLIPIKRLFFVYVF